MCAIGFVVGFSGIPQGTDPQEILQYFSWLGYAFVADWVQRLRLQ